MGTNPHKKLLEEIRQSLDDPTLDSPSALDHIRRLLEYDPPPTLGCTTDIPLLLRLANTLLSTIRLNKLTHLLLSVLVSETSSLFERSMLYLKVEKTGILQGMVGITRHESTGLIASDDEEDPLSGRWDIPDSVIARQRSSSFCTAVRGTRIEPHEECPISCAIAAAKPIFAERGDCICCEDTGIAAKFDMNSFAIVPLVSGGNCLGVLILDNPFSGISALAHHDKILRFISTQAGMAFESSLLYNRLESALQNLRDAQERLVHGERLAAIGEMAANVVHELKNPLITIGGFSSRLLKKFPDGTSEHRAVKTIFNEATRLEALLADILAFSRKPTVCFSLCDLGEIIRECLSGLRESFDDNSIAVTVRIPDAPCSIHGDAYQLKQVFLNLAINALDAMKNGGALAVSLLPDASHYEVVFHDTGGGIHQDILTRIFTPFFTTKHHGTGLGLPIANRLIQNHHGRIEVLNKDNGAMFRITLPAAPGDAC